MNIISFSYKLILKNPRGKNKMSIKEQQKQIQAKQAQIKHVNACFDIKQSFLRTKGWNFEEHYIYLLYLIRYRNVFKNQQSRKRQKVFSSLAKLITTRSPIQIKTHHHKMLIRHKSVHTIIQYFSQKLQRQIRDDPLVQHKLQSLNRRANRFFEEEQDKKNEYQIVKKIQPSRTSYKKPSQLIDNQIGQLKNEPKESNTYKLTFQERQLAPCKILCQEQISYIIYGQEYK